MKGGKWIGVLALSALMSISAAGYAQQRRMLTPEERADRQTQWMRKNLSLTPEQDKRVYDIMLMHARDIQKVKEEPGGRDRRMDMKAARGDMDKDLQQVLNRDQFKAYKVHIEEMKQRARDRRSGSVQGGEEY